MKNFLMFSILTLGIANASFGGQVYGQAQLPPSSIACDDTGNCNLPEGYKILDKTLYSKGAEYGFYSGIYSSQVLHYGYIYVKDGRIYGLTIGFNKFGYKPAEDVSGNRWKHDDEFAPDIARCFSIPDYCPYYPVVN